MDLRHKRILVFRVGHLGDTIVAMPAFWALREYYRDSELILLSNSDPRNPDYVSASNVLPLNGLFDGQMTYPAEDNLVRKGIGMLRLAANLRNLAPDAVYYLMPRLRTADQIERDRRFFRLAGVQNLIGLGHLSKNLLSHDAKPPLPSITSEYEYLLELLKFHGITPGNKIGSILAITNEEKRKADEFIAANLVDGDPRPRLIGIAPGSKWGSKVWPEDKFYSVVKKLIERFNVMPVVFGGGADREKGDKLIRRWHRGINAAGDLTVREAGAALMNCALYLGNDTGTMHLAAAAGTRCVGIFAALDYPGRWQPMGTGHFTFRERVECEGCLSPVCPNDLLCLEKIDVEAVIDACSSILAENEGVAVGTV